jgi:hypothetical protein
VEAGLKPPRPVWERGEAAADTITMSTPELHLQTLFQLDPAGRIVSTREPQASSGPAFILVRSPKITAWAIHTRVDARLARELDHLAQQEPPLSQMRDEPVNVNVYQSLIAGQIYSGPAFSFPPAMTPPSPAVVAIWDERLLQPHFPGWHEGEISAGRAPVMAVLDHGDPVSVCFSARSSEVAAEAGVETAIDFRGRGFAANVTAAWGMAVKAAGRIPLYSTAWSNTPSLGVARKLGLEPYATAWSISF